VIVDSRAVYGERGVLLLRCGISVLKCVEFLQSPSGEEALLGDPRVKVVSYEGLEQELRDECIR
jgi:hypothetical protein